MQTNYKVQISNVKPSSKIKFQILNFRHLVFDIGLKFELRILKFPCILASFEFVSLTARKLFKGKIV